MRFKHYVGDKEWKELCGVAYGVCILYVVYVMI